MGQASCQVGFEPLVDVIIKHLDEFGENEVYQAIISLERLIFFDEMRVCLLKRQEVLLLRRIY